MPRKPGWQHLVERFPGARFLWTARQYVNGHYLTDGTVSAYGIGPVVVLLVSYDDGGWQLYAPAAPDNSIAATLDAVAALVEQKPSRTLPPKFFLDAAHYIEEHYPDCPSQIVTGLRSAGGTL